MKILIRIVIAVLVVLAVAVVARNSIIENMTRKTVLRTTGFDIEIGQVKAQLVKPVFEIRNARLINPEDFPEATALDISMIRVGYDIPSFFKDEIHLHEVVLDASRAVLVIREDGESNLSRLGQVVTGAGQKKEGDEKPAEGEEKKAPKKVRVGVLTLRLGKVEVHQYKTADGKPEVDMYDVNFDRTARDVTDLNIVNGMITAGVIEAVGTKALRGLTKVFEENEGDLDKVGKQLEHTAKDVGKQLKGFLKDAGVKTD